MAAVPAPDLRPLSVGEVLDVAIKLYTKNAWTMFRIVLVVVAPLQLLVSLIEASAWTEGFWTTGETQTQVDPDEVWTFVAGMSLILVLSLLAPTIATGVCFKAVAAAYLGERPDWRASLGFVGRRLHSLLWVTFLSYVLGALALFALIVPGVWLFIAWTVAVPALLMEGIRGRKALGRSFRLVKGRWWPTFGIVLLGSLLAGVVTGVLTAAFEGLVFVAGESAVVRFLASAIGGTLGQLLVTPFTAAFVTVLYFDLRVRKEGFDLQLLAERIGVAPPATAGTVGARNGAKAAGSDGDDAGETPPFWPPPPGWKPRSEQSGEV